MITSLQNDQVKQVVALHKHKGRSQHREYLVEGKRFVKEALLRKAQVKRIYYVNEEEPRSLAEEACALGIPVFEVSAEVMRKMTATEEPQGILAIIGIRPVGWEDLMSRQPGSLEQPENLKKPGKLEKPGGRDEERDQIILILDNIQDPGNLGTILRTALAADVRRIILTKGTVDLYNPKVLRSSMGSIFSQTILTNAEPLEIVNFCRKHRYTLAATSMEGCSIFAADTRDIYPLALVIGSEASGISPELMAQVDKKYAIPMFNQVDSLNAAMAAGIFLYELRRQAEFL